MDAGMRVCSLVTRGITWDQLFVKLVATQVLYDQQMLEQSKAIATNDATLQMLFIESPPIARLCQEFSTCKRHLPDVYRTESDIRIENDSGNV